MTELRQAKKETHKGTKEQLFAPLHGHILHLALTLTVKRSARPV